MECSKVQADSLAYRTGDLAEEESVAIGQHLAQCPRCLDALRDLDTPLALVKTLPDITPSEDVWLNLQSKIGTPQPVKATSLRTLVRFAAAASLLVAALSFIFIATLSRPSHAATVSLVAPDSTTVKPGQRLLTGEPFRAPTYTVLTLPDIGLLKLNRDTEVCFETPSRLALKRGQLFAEVNHGFVVTSDDAIATVRGTRFGMVADGPSTVYVVEGSVSLRSTTGKTIELSAGSMATVGETVRELEDEHLSWLAPYEHVMLSLNASQPHFALGDTPTWALSFRTNSSAPLQLEPLSDLPQQLYLKVVDAEGKEYVSRLGATVQRLEARASKNFTHLDVMNPCVLAYRVDESLFPSRGRYSVALSYQGRQGVLQADPITIEVR